MSLVAKMLKELMLSSGTSMEEETRNGKSSMRRINQQNKIKDS
jgi:hypothetical protein